MWQGLKGGDYDASWDRLWGGGEAEVDAAHAVSDAEAPYAFHENNPHRGGAHLLEKGTQLFKRGEVRGARRVGGQRAASRLLATVPRVP
ncbi:hypothetical protein OAO87_02855 [bacterium]|nr:hypothetical protein [bacterium]